MRDIHILFMKREPRLSVRSDQVPDKSIRWVKKPLGNHKHWYPEVMYVLKGKCHYWLKNKEEETMECDLEEGDVMFRAPEVVHTCICTEDAILIDGSSESWINDDWNHVRDELVKPRPDDGKDAENKRISEEYK